MLSAPRPFAAADVCDAFDCGKPTLSAWLVQHALQAQGSGSSRTFVVIDSSSRRVAAYYSLAVGQVDTLEAPERVRKGMGRYPIPVVLLARLAVDLRFQQKGVGAGMLKDAIQRSLTIAQQAGVRALMTHPLDESAARFYRGFGFMPSPTSDDVLLLLLKDAQHLLTAR